jgi:hypothetical protein
MSYRLSLIATTLVFLIVLSAVFAHHSASAQSGRISNVTIEADRPNYAGPCPTAIRLTGKLQSNEPFGVVRYQFVHSDGTPGPVSQLNVNDKGGFTVEETLPKNASWNDTVFLRVFQPSPRLGPIPVDSNRITIKGQCQEVRSAPRQATISLGPATGHFRLQSSDD